MKGSRKKGEEDRPNVQCNSKKKKKRGESYKNRNVKEQKLKTTSFKYPLPKKHETSPSSFWCVFALNLSRS